MRLCRGVVRRDSVSPSPVPHARWAGRGWPRDCVSHKQLREVDTASERTLRSRGPERWREEPPATCDRVHLNHEYRQLSSGAK